MGVEIILVTSCYWWPTISASLMGHLYLIMCFLYLQRYLDKVRLARLFRSQISTANYWPATQACNTCRVYMSSRCSRKYISTPPWRVKFWFVLPPQPCPALVHAFLWFLRPSFLFEVSNNPSWNEYGYFLEPHITYKNFVCWHLQIKLN